MKRFVRAGCPDFWRDREATWKASDPRSTGKDAFKQRTHEGRAIGRWFHDLVRVDGQPKNCAYCDGRLNDTSPESIDHFIPEREAPDLGLSWENLYPACMWCNSTHKRDQWDVFLLRPEHIDEAWFDVDPQSGEIRPAGELDPVSARYVRFTVEILGLNKPDRPRTRLNVARDARNAWFAGDQERVLEMAREGPHRLVAERFIEAMKTDIPLLNAARARGPR